MFQLCTLLPSLCDSGRFVVKGSKELSKSSCHTPVFIPRVEENNLTAEVDQGEFEKSGAWTPVACCSPSKPVERLVNTDGAPFHTLQPDLADEGTVELKQ